MPRDAMTAAAERPQRLMWASPAGCGAALFVLSSLAVVSLFIHNLVEAFQSQTLRDFSNDLQQSRWAAAALLDYFVGAAVVASWIATRPTKQVAGLPHAVWAALLPPLGNPVAFLYLSLAVLHERSVVNAITPFDGETLAFPDGADCNAASRRKRWWWAVAFAGIAAAYFGVALHAAISEDMFTAFKTYFTERSLTRATFYDVLLGIAFYAILIIVRDGVSVLTLLWVSALGLLGNGVSCLYAVTVAWDALRWNISIGEAYATRKRPVRNLYV